MNCFCCDKGPMDGVSLVRVNPKGQPGVWACQEHVRQTDAKIDPEVAEIVSILEGAHA